MSDLHPRQRLSETQRFSEARYASSWITPGHSTRHGPLEFPFSLRVANLFRHGGPECRPAAGRGTALTVVNEAIISISPHDCHYSDRAQPALAMEVGRMRISVRQDLSLVGGHGTGPPRG